MLCIVSAIKEEIESLFDRFKTEFDPEVGIWRSSIAEIILAPLGVGYLESALRLLSILERVSDITQIVFTGSAGVYPGVTSVGTGELCCVDQTILVDGAAELNKSVYAQPLARAALKASLSIHSELYPAKVATLLTLTSSDALAATIQKNTGAELETMELYGIASVCQKKSIGWNGIIGITNTVGSNGHQEWRSNFRKLAEKTCQYLIDEVTKGALS